MSYFFFVHINRVLIQAFHSLLEFIVESLGALKTLEEGTIPIGLNSLSTINISKNSSGKSLLLS